MFAHEANSAPPPPEPAIVQTVARPDERWNRRIFKAPPLEIEPSPDLADFFQNTGYHVRPGRP